jgi:hypothetical protein
MVKIKVAAIIVMVSALVCSAMALPRQDNQRPNAIDGRWSVSFTIQGQTVNGDLTFQAEGEKLTGTVDSQHTGHGTLKDGKWANNKLSATCSFEKHESITLAGELKDGKLSGTFHTEGMDGAWEAVRAPQSN